MSFSLLGPIMVIPVGLGTVIPSVSVKSRTMRNELSTCYEWTGGDEPTSGPRARCCSVRASVAGCVVHPSGDAVCVPQQSEGSKTLEEGDRGTGSAGAHDCQGLRPFALLCDPYRVGNDSSVDPHTESGPGIESQALPWQARSSGAQLLR